MCHTEHSCAGSANICPCLCADRELCDSGEMRQTETVVKKPEYQLAHTRCREGNSLFYSSSVVWCSICNCASYRAGLWVQLLSFTQMGACVSSSPDLCTVEHQKEKFTTKQPLEIDLLSVRCVETKSMCDFRKWLKKLMRDNAKERME